MVCSNESLNEKAFIYFILPRHKYKEKIERIDLTMAKRPKGNYVTFIDQVSSVIELLKEVGYNYNIKWKVKLQKSPKRIYVKTTNSFYK